jgi:8-oxo-dGTP diphosphatase
VSNQQEHKNPKPTVDIIIKRDSEVLLVRRKKDPFKNYLSLPGGFVDEGERVEDAARREAKEETSLDIEPIEILGVYSDPRRDPRKHIMSIVFIVRIIDGNNNEAKAEAKDDAEQIEWMTLEDIDKKEFGFDHKKILLDYKKWLQQAGGEGGGGVAASRTFWSSKHDK